MVHALSHEGRGSRPKGLGVTMTALLKSGLSAVVEGDGEMDPAGEERQEEGQEEGGMVKEQGPAPSINEAKNHLGPRPPQSNNANGFPAARGGKGIPTTIVIREIYDSENAAEMFELQLEQALGNRIETIVIEPFKLGDETARWIAVGNCLHKTAVLAGFGSIISACVWPDKGFIFVPATILSTLCTGLYSVSWQFDPCCKYQVENDSRRLAQLSLQKLNTSSPVVLVRKDDTRRKILHTAVTLACFSQTALRLYFPYISHWFGGRTLNPMLEGVMRGDGGITTTDRLIVSELRGSHSQLAGINNTNTTATTSFMSSVFGGFNLI